MLELANVSKSFGGLAALRNVTFSLAAGEIKAVIGPNGAGKTTLFNIISGVVTPSDGSIRFLDREIVGDAPHRIARLGLSRTFQQAQLYRGMTAEETILLGLHRHGRAGLFACGFRLPQALKEEKAARARAREWLGFVGLGGREGRIARELPLGEQRYLEIARALATEPRLLLLDEPAAGLNDSETDQLGILLRKVRDLGITLLLIEHHMKFVMETSDSIVVLNFGEKIAEGAPETVRNSPAVVRAYLGSEDEDD